MRKLWLLMEDDYTPIDRDEDLFVHGSQIGTWRMEKERCKKCGVGSEVLTTPFQLEWEKGPGRQVPDFLFPGIAQNSCVATERVYDLLSTTSPGLTWDPVQMKGSPFPKRRPYDGPDLGWLRTGIKVPIAIEPSTIEVTGECQKCGHRFHKVSGMEKIKSSPDGESFKRIPRKPGEGLLVDSSHLKGFDDLIFGLEPLFRSWLVCTNEGKEWLNSHKFTNLMFREIGELF